MKLYRGILYAAGVDDANLCSDALETFCPQKNLNNLKWMQ